MKTIKYILFVMIFLILAGVANAVPIPTTWTDTIIVNQFISTGSQFTFNLGADTQVTPSPYTPRTDNIYSATLNIDFLGIGSGTFNIDNLQTRSYYVFLITELNVPLSCTVINDLSSTGLLQVIFYRACGIQWLDSITLTANGYDNSTAPVPEPGTIFLLGTGFIGLAIYGRRRMKK